ncbi:MAG: Kdo hydroxylase family protein [Pseudomonas sp.]|nr:Kdo hydroxylase family protein [Pseudomonas sp.]
MPEIISCSLDTWNVPASLSQQASVMDALEAGQVVLFPNLPFTLSDSERQLCESQIVGASKNISLTPATGALKGCKASEAEIAQLQAMMMRFANSARNLVGHVLAPYAQGVQQARTSFRPVEIAGRQTSWRKDDTRLHVDNFPSSPTQGKRILRVFSNVNPAGQPRKWRLGEPFEQVARQYLGKLPKPVWGSRRVLNALGITKSPRSSYDHYMMHLHDHMKGDLAYQARVGQQLWELPAGSTWMVFTDQVSHAAISGQFALEQTFLLPVNCMQHAERAPLRVLERMMGQALV